MPWHSGRSRPCGSLPPSGGRRVKPSRCISVMSDLAPIDRLPRSSWRRTVWRNTLKRGWPTGDADVHDGCEGRELKQERKADLSRRTHPCNSSMKYLPVKTNFRADRTFPYSPRLNLSIAHVRRGSLTGPNVEPGRDDITCALPASGGSPRQLRPNRKRPACRVRGLELVAEFPQSRCRQ